MENIIALDSYFTGLSGEAAVQSVLANWKIASSKIGESDFGEDLLCDIFISSGDGNANIRTNLTFRVQVKTTEDIENKKYIRKTKRGYSFSIEKSLLRLWSSNYYPTVLVIWDQRQCIGYWSIPPEHVDSNCISSKGKVSVHFDYTNKFLSSEQEIKNYIRHYYDGIYKTKNFSYHCNIYPIWMPKYRLFTAMELYKILNNKKNEDIFEVQCQISDFLPSYLTSYKNMNLNGAVPCLIYKSKAASLTEYFEILSKELSNTLADTSVGEWIAFIIGPIELVSEEGRHINRLTDWKAFSLINAHLVADYEYNFSLCEGFIYTQKIRASSDHQNLFIHETGNFALEVFVPGFTLASRNDADKKLNLLKNYSLCVWNISECNQQDKRKFKKWCSENKFSYYQLENNPEIVVIAHPFFITKEFGTLIPSASTWKELDSCNMSSNEFASLIPCGKPVADTMSEIIKKEYLEMVDYSCDEFYLQLEQALPGEVLNHSDRLIHFITYIYPNNKLKLDEEFEKIKENFYLKNVDGVIEKELTINYYEDDIADLILDVKPVLYISTANLVKTLCPIFLNIQKQLEPFCIQKHNMAYHVKYMLDRYLPEELVNK